MSDEDLIDKKHLRRKAYVYLLCREIPAILGQGNSLTHMTLGGQWINGSNNLYPAFPDHDSAKYFKEAVGDKSCSILAVQVAMDVPEDDEE